MAGATPAQTDCRAFAGQALIVGRIEYQQGFAGDHPCRRTLEMSGR
jgi:hypothetical protein